MKDVQELGRIKKVFFGKEDHGFLTFMIDFDFGGVSQGFGGYCLDDYCNVNKRRVGTAAGTDLVLRLLDLFGVDELRKIEGRVAFAIRESSNYGARIVGIKLPMFDGGKSFMIRDWQDDWFPDMANELKDAKS